MTEVLEGSVHDLVTETEPVENVEEVTGSTEASTDALPTGPMKSSQELLADDPYLDPIVVAPIEPELMYEPRSDIPEMTPEEATALLAASMPRDVDPTKQQLAYGRHAVPKLVYELDDLKLLTRQRSLVFLSSLLHSPENVAQALDEKIIPLLVSFLSKDDLCCRQKATEIFYILSGHSIGRVALITNEALWPLSKLFEEKDPLIRKHVHETFAKVTMTKDGVDHVLVRSLFVPIISKLAHERMDIQVPILETCYNCIRMGSDPYMPEIALNANALESFTDLARKSLVTEVKVAACRCIMMISFFHEAKKLATQSDAMVVLISLLSDRKSDVRAAAAGALMSITIDCDAKRIMVRENALSVLMDLLMDTNELVLLNSIKTIANCAEDYRGRFQLHHSIRKLEVLAKGSNAQVAAASKEAIAVISWRP